MVLIVAFNEKIFYIKKSNIRYSFQMDFLGHIWKAWSDDSAVRNGARLGASRTVQRKQLPAETARVGVQSYSGGHLHRALLCFNVPSVVKLGLDPLQGLAVDSIPEHGHAAQQKESCRQQAEHDPYAL